jgi:hypothetical protein
MFRFSLKFHDDSLYNEGIPMKNKYLVIFTGLIILFTTALCTTTPEEWQEQPVQPTHVNRELIPPDSVTLDNLENAAARAREIRYDIINNGFSAVLRQDWDVLDTFFLQTEFSIKNTTLRETQESIARYTYVTEAFEALNLKALNLNESTSDIYITFNDSYWDKYTTDEELDISLYAPIVPPQGARAGLSAAAAARAAASPETPVQTASVSPPPQVLPTASFIPPEVTPEAPSVLPATPAVAVVPITPPEVIREVPPAAPVIAAEPPPEVVPEALPVAVVIPITPPEAVPEAPPAPQPVLSVAPPVVAAVPIPPPEAAQEAPAPPPQVLPVTPPAVTAASVVAVTPPPEVIPETPSVAPAVAIVPITPPEVTPEAPSAPQPQILPVAPTVAAAPITQPEAAPETTHTPQPQVTVEPETVVGTPIIAAIPPVTPRQETRVSIPPVIETPEITPAPLPVFEPEDKPYKTENNYTFMPIYQQTNIIPEKKPVNENSGNIFLTIFILMFIVPAGILLISIRRNKIR